MEKEILVELPGDCECDAKNLKIWGTRINGDLKIDVRCVRCGKILWKIKKPEKRLIISGLHHG